MPKIPYYCRITTTWTKSGAFDEEAYRQFLQRYIDNDIGVMMASPGIEGRSMTLDELLRVYQVGMEYCQGKVPIGASGIEENTAAATIARAKVGIEAGLEIVGIYGPAGFHGFRATDTEYLRFFEIVFDQIEYPVAVSPNGILGYLPSPELFAEVCNRHPQVKAVVLTGVPSEMYFIALKEYLRPDVETYVEWHGSLEILAMGPTGLSGSNGAVILPKTMRTYLDAYADRNYDQAVRSYYEMRRYEVFSAPWNKGSIARATKMAMKGFKLPGGEGGMREPYRMPDDIEVAKFVAGAVQLNIPEINEMAEIAGISLPN